MENVGFVDIHSGSMTEIDGRSKAVTIKLLRDGLYFALPLRFLAVGGLVLLIPIACIVMFCVFEYSFLEHASHQFLVQVVRSEIESAFFATRACWLSLIIRRSVGMPCVSVFLCVPIDFPIFQSSSLAFSPRMSHLCWSWSSCISGLWMSISEGNSFVPLFGLRCV